MTVRAGRDWAKEASTVRNGPSRPIASERVSLSFFVQNFRARYEVETLRYILSFW
jgi:hypothetical protein